MLIKYIWPFEILQSETFTVTGLVATNLSSMKKKETWKIAEKESRERGKEKTCKSRALILAEELLFVASYRPRFLFL